MNKYSIILQGRGCEFNLHKIDEEQRSKLEHLNLRECILEDVCDILNKDFEDLLSSEKIILGGVPENCDITVFGGENETVYKDLVQDILFQELHNPESKMDELYETNTFYVEDNIKGIFFSIDVEDEETFDISKLKINITDIEGQDYVTSIEYKGVEGSFGDYWSKGIHFFISHE
jgi:hypothetical protein